VSASRARRFSLLLATACGLAAVFLLPARRPLPFDLCMLHRLTGLSCPTCGLSRAVCLFAHGEWSASLAMHPAGWLAFLVLPIATVWLSCETVVDRNLGQAVRRRLAASALILGGALSAIVFVARLAGLWATV
jgi:hypothetical protein